jgi:hypothetical protein
MATHVTLKIQEVPVELKSSLGGATLNMEEFRSITSDLTEKLNEAGHVGEYVFIEKPWKTRAEALVLVISNPKILKILEKHSDISDVNWTRRNTLQRSMRGDPAKIVEVTVKLDLPQGFSRLDELISHAPDSSPLDKLVKYRAAAIASLEKRLIERGLERNFIIPGDQKSGTNDMITVIGTKAVQRLLTRSNPKRQS